MLIDTDVLVWYLRGRESARVALGRLDDVSLPAIVYMELVRGVRDKTELRLLRQTIRRRGWRTVPLSENIGHRATVYLESHALSHGLQLADALIAASAAESGDALMTANVKHYRVVPDIELVRFRP